VLGAPTLSKIVEYHKAMSTEKFELTSQNPNFSTINWLFIEIISLFLEFLLEIDFFIENRSTIWLKFFTSTGSSVTTIVAGSPRTLPQGLQFSVYEELSENFV
jgi:hypothetical protein